MSKFILITVDGTIEEPEMFNTHKEAFDEMFKSIKNIYGVNDYDWDTVKDLEAYETFSFGFSLNGAWMCFLREVQWKIFEVNV